MQATEEQLEVLEKLQEADRTAALARRDLEALPQRAAIIELRKKKADVLKKKVQVQDLLDETENQLAKLADEDARLAEKQRESEAELKGTGDFRAVEARSKELNGIVKRRRKLSDQLEDLEGQQAKILPVMERAMQALEVLEAKERKLVESFREEGGALQIKVARSEKTRDALIVQLPPDVSKAYETALARCGGVALAHETEGRCSACRSTFDQARISQIRDQAPLAECPSCHRLLIVG